MLRRWYISVAVFLLTMGGASHGWGQKAQFDRIIASGRGLPEAGVTITVCSDAGVLIPTRTTLIDGCSPKATIYADPAGNNIKPNPFLTDGLGNAVFYADPGVNWYTYAVTGPVVNPRIFIWVPGGGGSSSPCTSLAAGLKDIAPQTCAGMWTLQNLAAYEATSPTFIVYPAAQPGQIVPNFYAGDPTSGFSDGVGTGDTNYTGRQYTSLTANNALTFHGLGCLDPAAKGSEPMSDCLVVYNQQNGAATPTYLAAAIKGIMEQIDTHNAKCSLCVGISGKAIQSGTGNNAENIGVDGELINNGNGGAVAESEALRAWFNLSGTNTNVYGLKIERLDNQSCTRCFAWGYRGGATNLPTSYLDGANNMVVGDPARSAVGTVLTTQYFTALNCQAGNGNCNGRAAAGQVRISASATTATVSTTALTANSEILIQEDSTLGTALSITCNTTTGRTYTVTSRTAGTSFVITASAAPVTNPACLSWWIVN